MSQVTVSLGDVILMLSLATHTSSEPTYLDHQTKVRCKKCKVQLLLKDWSRRTSLTSLVEIVTPSLGLE